MFRATTPLHTFIFPEDAETAYDEILITYSQNGAIVMEKTKEDLTFETETEGSSEVYLASFRLTQEEANLFTTKSAGSIAMVQVRVMDTNGHVYASEQKRVTVQEVLDDQVLGDGEGSGTST